MFAYEVVLKGGEFSNNKKIFIWQELKKDYSPYLYL